MSDGWYENRLLSNNTAGMLMAVAARRVEEECVSIL